MQKNIFVGNLPWSVTGEDLKVLFEKHGQVSEASVITEKETSRSRGFGFVKMNAEDADRAIQDLNGYEIGGRQLNVNEAKPRNDSGPRRNDRGPGRYDSPPPRDDRRGRRDDRGRGRDRGGDRW